MDKKSFLVYLEWEEALEDLGYEALGRLFKAMMYYAKTGNVEFLETPEEKMAFKFMKKQFDKNDQAYEEKCKRNKENGAKGGRPKNQTDIQETERILEKPKKPDKDKDKDKDKDIKESVAKKIAFGKHNNVFMTKDEYNTLASDFDSQMIRNKIEYLSSKIKNSITRYLEYKDHYAAIHEWCRQDTEKKEQEKIKPVNNTKPPGVWSYSGQRVPDDNFFENLEKN